VPELPTGTVTFLFTDLEGSTRLWEEHPDAMRDALARHDEILSEAVSTHDGHVVKKTGDGVHAVFASAHDAATAALGAQRHLATETWKNIPGLTVRMGLHTCEAELRDGDYYGSGVNRAARLMSVAHGGQVVASLATGELLRDDDFETVDLGEHRLRDLARGERVVQLSVPGSVAEFPPLRSLDAFPGNLPAQLTSFVGRDDELREIAKALDEWRMITLTGVGGVGKTRLAIQVAAEVVPAFIDGAWLCELASAVDAETMVQIVAASIGARPRHDMDLDGAVVEYLKTRRLLLVLDNCEHLLEPVSRLVEAVLQECPGVRALATSREGLAVMGERVWPLRSLGVPSDQVSVSDAIANDSVRLFAERAGAVRRGFDVDASNAAAVVEICRRLDGMPLAIELAAARASAMSTNDIARHLDERFRLLTGGRRTAVERHQTLRATVDWSYSLLDDRERAVFDRLGVFAGSFDGDAAAAVTAGDDLDPWDVLDALAALVGKSMVGAEESADGATRYSMLETLRQYARERLDESGDADAWRRRHADYFAAFAEEASKELEGRDEFQWRRRLHEELDNLRAALTWSLDSQLEEDAELAVRIVAALSFQAVLDRTAGIASWAERVLPLANRAARQLRVGVISAAAWNAAMRGDYARASALSDGVIGADDPGSTPLNIYGPATLASMYSGDFHRCGRLISECEGLIREGAEQETDWQVVMIRAIAAILEILIGDLDNARARTGALLESARRSQSPTALALSLYTFGWASQYDDPGAALGALDESVELVRAGATDMIFSHALVRSAAIRARGGDQHAIEGLREAIAYAHDIGSKTTIMTALDVAVWILADLDKVAIAGELAGFLDAGVTIALNPVIGAELDERMQSRAHLRALLGDARYDALAARGAAMSYEEMIPYLLGALDQVIAQVDDV
jgi:predicted ATPase/class 3 adenylate cyclase